METIVSPFMVPLLQTQYILQLVQIPTTQVKVTIIPCVITSFGCFSNSVVGYNFVVN